MSGCIFLRMLLCIDEETTRNIGNHPEHPPFYPMLGIFLPYPELGRKASMRSFRDVILNSARTEYRT